MKIKLQSTMPNFISFFFWSSIYKKLYNPFQPSVNFLFFCPKTHKKTSFTLQIAYKPANKYKPPLSSLIHMLLLFFIQV